MEDTIDTSTRSKYKALREHGKLLLEDAEIDLVIKKFSSGITDVAQHLGRKDIDGILTFGGPKISQIGYEPKIDKIIFPVTLLQNLGKAKQETGNINNINMRSGVNEFVIKAKLPRFLQSAGREEAIHLFANRGDSRLIHISDNLNPEYFHLPDLWRFLVDFETQARELSDVISVAKGEEPYWKECNEFMSQSYPNLYRKSSSELVEMYKNK